MKKIFLLIGFILFCNQAFATTEDFSTYTEVDNGSDITVVTGTITADTQRRDANNSVYKDFGASYFGNFVHEFTLRINAATQYGRAGIWSLSNVAAATIGDISAANNGYYAYIEAEPFNHVRFYLVNEQLDSTDSIPLYASTIPYNTANTVYITITKTSSDLSMSIYSNAARTTLVDTLTVSRDSNTYRYLATLSSQEDGNSGSTTWSYAIGTMTLTDTSGGVQSPPLQESSNHLIFR